MVEHEVQGETKHFVILKNVYRNYSPGHVFPPLVRSDVRTYRTEGRFVDLISMMLS